MKKTIFIALGALILTSCGGADCSCDEVVKKSGKYYLSGAQKVGNRVTFGELYTGSCETLNDAGQVIESAEFNNGFILNKKEWKEVDGELYQVLDMTYDNNKRKDGYSMKLERHHEYLYPIEYNEYKGGKDVAHYSMQNAYGKTVVSGDLGSGFFEAPCKLEGYDNSKSDMKSFLDCISKEKLPKFFVKE